MATVQCRTFDQRVLNAVAYARYAVDLLSDQDTGRMESLCDRISPGE